MDFNWVLILNIVTKIINVEIEMLRKKITSEKKTKRISDLSQLIKGG